MPLRTLQLWKRHDDKFGESPAAIQPALGKRFGKKRGHKGKVRLGHLRLLKEIVEENPAWYLDEISDEFHRRNQDGQTFHYTTLWRASCGTDAATRSAPAPPRPRSETRCSGPSAASRARPSRARDVCLR